MKFKSFVGKQVFIGGAIVTFKAGEYETTDKDAIAALLKVKGVEQVEVKPKVKAVKAD